ncbi:cytochrome c biogenesis protein [Lentzea sp. NBRC 105346]|uniref:carbohydrate ABC transporter permease n=1 Tax=Lentzea sp. NBRC 105346 TaxID=3032205 RepID=UPI0024A1A0B7|nr:sugar ABC transporter permease [Lentzea sp. NBRC 105346]GLZ34169.1 cytochrome c biogenesis protein [Lentzea sp. NBRC 105346]
MRKYLPQYLAISPFFLLFGIFGLFPMLFLLYLAFQNWDGVGAMRFVGLDQFRYLVSDDVFWRSLVNTLEIWVLSTVPTLFLGLVIAFVLHSSVRFTTFYRIAYFVPSVTSLVAVAIVFGSIFSSNFGLLNAVLNALGAAEVPWLTSEWGIKVSISALIVWQWTGYNAIIYLAGLQAISSDVFDAATVDGASRWQTLWRIVIPMMKPVILFTVIASTIGGLQTFTEAQILVGEEGGPGQAGLTMVLYLYQQAFKHNDFGYGAAIGVGLFVVVLLFSIINWRLVQRGERA